MTVQSTTELPVNLARRWVMAEPPPHDAVTRLCEELRIPEPITRVLYQRGITSFEGARLFFRPSLEHLHDPFLMDGMAAATTRILDALRATERLRVYGDYDVDGTNGAAMLSLFLRNVGANVDAYVPDRLKEGYGLSQLGIERAHAEGVTLLITVDCGITAADQVLVARRLGIDVIICDHHEAGSTIPEATAVLDPIKPGDPYPFKGLCGCGVAFKLIQALAGKLGLTSSLPSYLEFVTLGTIADIVPINDENRVMVRIGLEKINQDPRPGVKALVQQAGFRTSKVSTGQVVFGLAPRINAVGRLGDAMRAVRLLLCEENDEARDLARILEDENRERRRIDEETFEEAIALFEQNPKYADESAIVLHSGDWHAGVIGIVASRMVERYYRPSIMLATVDGVAKGSARSIPGFDIFKALSQCSDLMMQFGGHRYAAGLTVDLSSVDEFSRRFKEMVDAALSDEDRIPSIRIDTEISLSDLTPRFVRILREFAPFGPGNQRPVFLTRGLEISGKPRIVGKNHLKFRVRQLGTTFDAIGFGLGSFLSEIESNPSRTGLECVFSLEENDFAPRSGGTDGDTMPQLKVRDLRFQGTGTNVGSLPIHQPSTGRVGGS